MTVSKLITAFVGVIAALALTVGMAPANATVGSSVTSAVAAKPVHQFKSLYVSEPRPNQFRVRGQVTSYTNKMVTLSKQNRKGGKWYFLKSVRSNKYGGFTINFGGRIGNGFRVIIPATKWRAKRVQFVARLVPQRAGARATPNA